MSPPDLESVVHLIASFAPAVFGVLIASVVFLNIVAYFTYRRVAENGKRLEEAIAKYGGVEGEIASVIARNESTLQRIQQHIERLELTDAEELSIDEQRELAEQLAELNELKREQAELLANAHKYARRYEQFEPQMQASIKEAKTLRETFYSQNLFILFIARWLEYFGNRPPATTAVERQQKERTDD